MSDNRRKTSNYSKLRGFDRAVPIILAALALFLGLCFILQDTGSFGRAISSVLLGLFSYGAYSIPVLIALHAVFYPSDAVKRRRISRAVFSVVVILMISSAVYVFSHLDGEVSFSAAGYYADGQSLVGGGFVGSTIAFGLIKAIGVVGYFILAVAVIAIYITYFVARSNMSVAKVFYGALSSIAGAFASAEKKIEKNKKAKEAARAEKNRKRDDERRKDLYRDDYFEVDNGMQELSIDELGISERRSRASIEMNPTLSDSVHHKSATESSAPRASRDDGEIFFSDGTVTVKLNDKTKRQEKTLDLDYGIEKEATEIATEPESQRRANPVGSASAGIDESAESVFTKDFDPFDFVMGEKLASKPSSRASDAVKTERSEGLGVFEQSISNLTEEDVAKARRQAEFEERKKMIIDRENAYRRAQEARRSAAASTEPVKTEPTYSEPVKTETIYSESMRADYSEARTERSEEAPIFKPYTPPSPSYEPVREVHESDTIRIERSMLEPEVKDEPSFTERQSFSFDNGFAEEVLEELPAVDVEEIPSADPEDVEEEMTVTAQPEEDIAEPLGEPIPDAEQSKTVLEQRRMFTIFDEPENTEPTEQITAGSPESADTTDDFPDVAVSDYTEDDDVIVNDATEDDDDPPFEIDEPVSYVEVKAEPIYREPVKEAPPAPQKPDYSNYQLPPIDLLSKEDNGIGDETNSETADNANKLIETLASFNVTASIKGFDRGPRITRYEVVPARGVKVSSIMSLFDDIALNLAAEGIRMEAPIPGKSAVGVEIPNSKPYTVKLRSLLETEEFANGKSKTQVCVGKDVAGQPVFGDISKMPHVLIAGATGMGKSVCINSLLLSMLYKARPDEVKFIMIDPKKVEFNMYNGIPHLLIPVVTDPKQAAGALMWAVEQMEKRYDLIEQARVRNIEAYNAKVAENPDMGEPMPKIVIVVDELADLMLQVKNPVEGLIMSIAQKARAAGIHLIIGTQRPSVDIITGVIKANIPTRISCKVMSNADSRTILDIAGAEKLLDKGDMLFNPAGAPKPKRVQGAFVSDSEVESIIEFIKSQASGNVYDDQALEEINRAAQKCSKDKSGGGRGGYDDDGDSGDDGGLYNNQEFRDAVDVAVSSGKISTSLLQRKLSIGFGKAAKFIDGMEDLGIVSGPNGQKPRDVLITKDEWQEKLARVSLD